MDHSTGNAGAAIFAAEGSTRHRLVRVGVAAGAALLAAWLIALALGVLGGFGSLPGLPSDHATGSSEASSPVKRAGPRAAHASSGASQPVTAKTVTTSPVRDTSSQPQSQSPAPKTQANQIVQQPTTSASTTSTAHGKSSTHTTQTTGKPVGSPGNGSGGSGAPGQLR